MTDTNTPKTDTEEMIQTWEKAFHTSPSDKEKFYLTVAYPYPSGAMHVGHGRTYIAPDVIARFKRMQGFEVLYPMAFHVTGAPVVGISRRIAAQDEKTINLYRDLYRVPQDVLSRFSDPLEIVNHFSNEYERVMKKAGLSIDWTRKFTTVDPRYSKFIEWQWFHLRAGAHVAKGAHPVRYCPQCDNPIGDHDILEGDTAEVQKFTLVMFRYGDELIPCATLRPETVYGVTNLWVHPDVEYVKTKIDGQIWIISPEAAKKISLQDHDVDVVGTIPGSELVDTTANNKFCGEIPILPAVFVDPDMATGVVMSVPAHAPFDYIALRDLWNQGRYTSIKPIGLIQVDGYGEHPAVEAVEESGILHQNDPNLDDLTAQVYLAEHSTGKMYPQYGGKPVKIAREEVAAMLTEQYGSTIMYEFSQHPVVCRCGSRAYVKVLHDQWFLEYSDQEWKDQVQKHLNTMSLVPHEVRAEFDRTVGWLKEWACTRRVGLGTRLPWDPSWLIEPLSDSTIYMAYYTIAEKIKELESEVLTPEVFDYIFLGVESAELPKGAVREKLDAMRAEFLYWYPYDYRFSAKDLISNHLTFQVFHHCAIFPEHLCPHGMVVFGMGLLNGAKMTSSKGNVYLLEEAISDFGADTVRMFLVGSGEPWQDFDWRYELVKSTQKQIERFVSTIQECMNADGADTPIDHWLRSRIQEYIKLTTLALDSFQTRQAIHLAFFSMERDLRWYKKRLSGAAPSRTLMRELASVWIRLLCPIIPFTAEQLWKEMGEEGLCSFAPWPVPDETAIDIRCENAEELLMRTGEDLESILRIIQITPKNVTIVVAPVWKWEIFSKVQQSSAQGVGNIIKALMQDPEIRAHGEAAVGAVKDCSALMHRLPPDLAASLAANPPQEMQIFCDAKSFIEHAFSVSVTVVSSDESTHDKAQHAAPFKPALILE